MSVVSMSVGKEGERKKYLPLEIRMQMYEDVIKLRKQGLIYKEIQRRIYEKYGKQISIATISLWIGKKHHPLGRVNKFDGKPLSELAYIIGAILGDGNKHFHRKSSNYRLRLGVKDYEFAEEFGKCLAKVLNQKEPYKPIWDKKKKRWTVVGYSVLLYKFLNRPLEELKPYIEHSKDTVSAFLRALFDGEGSAYKRDFRLYNTNKELSNYTKYLLKEYFEIDATGLHLVVKSGTITRTPNGSHKCNKDYYYIYIRAKSLLNFYKYIGFIIQRKRQKLIEAIE